MYVARLLRRRRKYVDGKMRLRKVVLCYKDPIIAWAYC